jgi:endoglucanase
LNALAMAVPELLRTLLTTAGPSGQESAVASVWRDAAASFAEVGSDAMGSSFARVRARGGADAPTLAVVGHIDEIGVVVTNIEDSGLLSYSTVGGISPETLLGQRLGLLTRGGRVPALVARKRLYPDPTRDRSRVQHDELHLDVGAKSREEAERLVRVGDVGVWIGPPLELPNGRLASKSLDNRLGSFIALETARRVAESGGAEWDVVAVAAVQEEIGPWGARAAAFGLEPAAAIAVDVTPATDYPGGEPRRAGAIELGSGAMIARGSILSPAVSDALADAADAEKIPHAFEVYSDVTNTDADEIHLVRAGVPTGLVSIPTRYLHTPNELCQLDDVEAIVRLLAAFAGRLSRDGVFTR